MVSWCGEGSCESCHGSGANCPCDLEQDLNCIRETALMGSHMGRGSWVPMASPPIGPGTVPSWPGRLHWGQLGSPGPHTPQHPGHGSAQPGKCRLVHSFYPRLCLLSAEKGP